MQQQILYLCNANRDCEWSGVLFYTTSGNFGEKPFEVFLQDILLMDIGTNVTTSFLYDDKVAEHLLKHTSLFESSIGSIHSHHDMDVFFSDDDIDDLKKNSEKNNIYLSVVVNNRNEFIAKIAHRLHRKTITQSVSYFNDQNGKLSETPMCTTENCVQLCRIIDCEPLMYQADLDKDFFDRVQELKISDKTIFYESQNEFEFY